MEEESNAFALIWDANWGGHLDLSAVQLQEALKLIGKARIFICVCQALSNGVEVTATEWQRLKEAYTGAEPILRIVRSTNDALHIARSERLDAVLLKAGPRMGFSGVVEMVEVARLDPMIGFVIPVALQSQNASSSRTIQQDDAFGSVQLPRYSFAPPESSHCVCVRHFMLEEFGSLDEAYESMEFALLDFMSRCNKRGFRVAVANNVASVPVNFDISNSDHKDCAKFEGIYPEYRNLRARHAASPEVKAKLLIADLAADPNRRLRLLFECSYLQCIRNGTSEFACNLIDEFCKQYGNTFDCYICSSAEAFEFHKFSSIAGLTFISEEMLRSSDSIFAVAICPAQPFKSDAISNLCSLAPVTGHFILDTISYDCAYLNAPDLEVVWSKMLQCSSLICYISAFSRDQFRRRFSIPSSTIEGVCLLSTDTDEYRSAQAKPTRLALNEKPFLNGGYVLVIGNNYCHKGVAEAVGLLSSSIPSLRIVAVGLAHSDSAYVHCIASGAIEDSEMNALYEHASIVVYPSYYEGFGFPIMHALAYRKPIIARDETVAREVKERASYGNNVHLSKTTKEMVRLVQCGLSWDEVDRSTTPPQRWADAASDLHRAIRQATRDLTFQQLVERVMLAENLRPLGTPVPLRKSALAAIWVAKHLERSLEVLLYSPLARQLRRVLTLRSK